MLLQGFVLLTRPVAALAAYSAPSVQETIGYEDWMKDPLNRSITLPRVSDARNTVCERWGLVPAAEHFVLSNNLWHDENAIGQQCSTLVSAESSRASWFTTYDWTPKTMPANQVLSYSNLWLQFSDEKGQEGEEEEEEGAGEEEKEEGGAREAAVIVEIAEIKTSVQLEYAGYQVIANVAYDIFLSHAQRETIEVMVQLGAYHGAKPISGTDGPVAMAEIDGKVWHLYAGRNAYAQSDVYSFVAVGAAQAVGINAALDLKLFLHYLMQHNHVQADYRLVSIGFGTEVFRGKGVFYVKSYSLDLLYK